MKIATRLLALLVSAAVFCAASTVTLLVTNATGVVANITNVPFIGGCDASGVMNAWQVTLLAGATTPEAVVVEWQLYPGLGPFVTAIDGVAGSDSEYWALSLNGKGASVGAQELLVAPGDVVGWTLTAGSRDDRRKSGL